MNKVFDKQRNTALQLMRHGLERMKPAELVRRSVTYDEQELRVEQTVWPVNKDTRIWVFGAGKAVGHMARGLEEQLGRRIHDGVLLVPYGHQASLQRIQQFQARHPIPDEHNRAATLEMLAVAERARPGDVVFFLLSGGSSSLLCLPDKALPLGDKQRAHELLLESGADISEMNTVRKEFSRIKGGGLLSAFAGTHLIELIISDVPGNRLEDIGSGPLTKKRTGPADALHIIDRYGLMDRMPVSVLSLLKKRLEAEPAGVGEGASDPEQDKPEDRRSATAPAAEATAPLEKQTGPASHVTRIVGSAGMLAGEVASRAREMGLNTHVEEAYREETHEVARRIARQAISVHESGTPVAPPAALIFTGESYLNVTGWGKGGRNQQLALAVAIGIEGDRPITLLSVGTDGRDGPTDAAGAICHSQTALAARKRGLEPERYLSRNDTYHFFSAMRGLVMTGPTGNNLMDLQIVLIDR